jgi:superfamily II RNA helicase
VEPTYAWSSGQSIYEITNKFEGVYEGTFIRNILRIHNMLENIKNIFQTVDNSVMVKKLENIENLLLRDQVTTESLYITKE